MHPEHIRTLIKEGRDTLIQAWSIQHRCAISEMESGRYVASYNFVDPRRMHATRWMADEMRQRSMAIGLEEAPIWIFFEKPLARNNIAWGGVWTKEYKLLNLSITRGEILISYHFPWSSRFLPIYPGNAHISSSSAERVSLGYMCPTRAVCELSWQKLFDLSLAENEDLSWSDSLSILNPEDREILLRMQATTSFLTPANLNYIAQDW